MNRGLSLIEMSVVLVIVGLLIGGVVVGRNLVEAAGVRGQLGQIEKYQSAMHSFESKYGGLPGDITSAIATQYGFAARGTCSGGLPCLGEGDGNGTIESNWGDCGGGCNNGQSQGMGETVMFWSDLTYANGKNINMIEGTFKTATNSGTQQFTNITNVGLYLPQAKLGHGNYVYVWSGGPTTNGFVTTDGNGISYFGVLPVKSIVTSGLCYGCVQITNKGLTVKEAYAMDTKMDDGLPQAGTVMAMYVATTAGYWGAWAGAASGSNGPTTAATAGSSTTCYDNNNTNGANQQYSITQTSNSGLNCALSFQFQ